MATDKCAAQYQGDGVGGADWPVQSWAALTPNNGADLTETPNALYVDVTGDVEIVGRDGTSLVFHAVAAGTILPVRARRLKTGTTATVYGLYQ